MKPTKAYTDLRTAIQETLSDGHLRAQKAVERQRVIAYWTVGDHTVRFLDTNPIAYGSQVMKQLSTGLNLRERLLYDIVQFRRSVPKLPSKAILSWSHYRELISVKTVLQEDLSTKALDQVWTVSELKKQIVGSTKQPSPPKMKTSHPWS